MDERKRQLLSIGLITALSLGGYVLIKEFVLPEEPSAAEGLSTETAEEGDATESADGNAEDSDAESDAADGDTEGEDPTSDVVADGSDDVQVDPAQRLEAQELFTIETDRFVATLTNLNTALKSLRVKGERYLEEDDDGNQAPHEVVSTDLEEFYPLQVELGGVRIPASAVWEGEQLSPTAVRFTWTGGGFRVVRKLEAGSAPYQIWSTVRVRNLGSAARPVRLTAKTYHYVLRDDEGGGFMFARPSPAASRGICYYGDEDTERIDRATLEEDGPQTLSPAVRFSGIENNYFALVTAADGDPAERCYLQSTPYYRDGEEHASLFEAKLIYPRTELGGGEDVQYRTLSYVGPKDLDALSAAGHHLHDIVDFGWFGIISEGMVQLLRWIHDTTGGGWGLAIILLTVLMKLLLYPLTEKSFQSMAKMRMLKPEMDRINELYADDREKKTAATMELYRKEGINPVGGCLPTLLQMPIWFALYQSLSTNVELYHASFVLWWTDLSAPDEYYVLPLILGGLMFLQQKLSPTTPDAAQAKIMMYVMPIMITFFMLFLPAGLCLYMVTNSVLGIVQQQSIHYRLQKKMAEQESGSDSETSESPADSGGELATAPGPQKGKATSAPSKKSKRRKSRGRA